MQYLIIALALAAAPKDPPPSPRLAVIQASKDLEGIVDSLKIRGIEKDKIIEQTRYLRYMWLNGENKYLEDDLITLAFHCNLLSNKAPLAPITLISPNVVRLNMKHFGWEKRLLVWEKLGDIDIFFHWKVKLLKDADVEIVWPGGIDPVYEKHFEAGIYPNVTKKAGELVTQPSGWLPEKEITYLRHNLLTEVPIVNAHWFFVQTARQISIRNVEEGVGYYEWLGLKNRQDFFDATGLDKKKALKVATEYRAVVEAGKSGISQQNRQIFSLGAASGRVWATLDVFSQTGRGEAKENLRRGEFAHDAEEWYGFLPNGLPITFLSDKKGVRQASAPDKIGGDKSALNIGNDPRVHANLSCIRCHGPSKDMLQPIDDWARRAFRQGGVLRLVDKSEEVKIELQTAYLRDLNEILDDDRVKYIRAIARVTATKTNPTGLSSTRIAGLYGKYWNRYVESSKYPVTVEVAARELGTWSWKLKQAIVRHTKLRGAGSTILTSFIDEPEGTISRLEWERVYAFAQVLIHDIHLPEIEETVKGK